MTDIKLSIIIPVLNDAVVLTRLLEQISSQRFDGLELVVADGGSHDHSVAVARAAGVSVVESPPGRGRQMNAAAQVAQGQQWLFLHADSWLPHPGFLQDAFEFMSHHLAIQPRSVGHFPLQFIDVPPGRGWMWRFWEEKTRFNRPECIHGDQGLWISRSFFQELGGFDTTYPFLEERHVTREVAQRGQWLLLPGYLGTSARRFVREGLARRAVLNALIMTCHELGHHDFLQSAPALYREQAATGLLPMAAFFRLLLMLDHAVPKHIRRQRWRAAGVLLRQSLWQVFLFMDVVSRGTVLPGRGLFLTFYNRFLDPLLPWLLPDFLAEWCAWLLFHGVRLGFQWGKEVP
ncbi:MAG: glycosyltransferase [Magnetococcales bacterium]|nr:glycosyltransferase [Magnetococcales bacterium]MBF0151006.1 glycosyltransferase [Magnetococcales bacterium]